MRLLVISYLYSPDTCGGAPIFADLCQGLARTGMDVTVRCAYPFYPEWHDKSGHNGWKIERIDEDGVHIERYGMVIPRNPRSFGQRILYEGSYLLSLCRGLVGRTKFDAVLVFCPMMGSVVFGVLYKLLHGTPMVLDVEDMPADAAAAGGITKSGKLTQILRWIQKSLFRRYDVIRTISPVMVARLEHMTGRPVVHVPHWVHPSLARLITTMPTKLGRKPSDPIKLLYSGNLGTKQGLLGLCRALHASDMQFEFRINCGGSGVLQLSQWAHDTGDARFSVGPLVSEAELVRALYDADYFVITEKPDAEASFFPSKLIPAIATDTPILAVSSRHSPLGCEVIEHNLGLWFDWDQVDSIGAALRVVPVEDYTRWQFSAMERSAFYNRATQINKIANILRVLAGVVDGAAVQSSADTVIIAK